VIYSGGLRLRDLAERLACRLEGDGEIEIRSVAGLLQAGQGDLSFLANNRYTSTMLRTRASAVILGEDAPAAPCAMLRAKDPYLAFAEAMAVFVVTDRPEPGIHPLSSVAADAVIGEGAYVGPFVAIGSQVAIGDRDGEPVAHP